MGKLVDSRGLQAKVATLWALLVLLLAACGTTAQILPPHSAPPPKNQITWLLNARILNPEAQTERLGHVLLKAGRILRVQRQRPRDPGVHSLDLKGAWLLPAFVDLHVHSWGNPSPQEGPDHSCGHQETARLMLYAGVVAYLDLGSKQGPILALRDRLRRDEVRGASLYASGAVFGHILGMTQRSRAENAANAANAADSAGLRLRQVTSPEHARQQVRAMAALKPDIIKVLMDHTGPGQDLTPASLNAIVSEAKKHHLRVICHIGTWQDARACVQAGASALTHLWDETDVPADLIQLMVKHKIPLIPTQPVQVDMPRYCGPKAVGWRDPLLRKLTPEKLQKDYRNTATFVEKAKFWLRYQGPHTKQYERQLRRLHRGGVQLLAGSDTGNFGTFQGYSLHRELALMVQAGLPIWTALKAGTTAAGRFLGRRLGVEPGDEASFVVLGASPLVRIDHTQRIVHVIQRGKLVDRPALLRGGSVGDNR